jgi:cold shock CspA family protein
MQGRVLRWGQTHGYGFIEAEDGSDYFFHASAVVGGIPIEDLRTGDHVLFEVAMTAHGPAALGVERAALEGVITGLQNGDGPGHGFGFLCPAEGGPERFFHFSRLAPSGLAAGDLFARLRVGDRVRYRESRGNVGERARAVDVVPLSISQTHAGDQTPARITNEQDNTTMMDQQPGADTQPTRRDGTITRLVLDRGFGFIAPQNSREAIFFHARALRDVSFDDLEEGTRLTFVEGVDRDGRPCAVDVCLLDDDTAVA